MAQLQRFAGYDLGLIHEGFHLETDQRLDDAVQLLTFVADNGVQGQHRYSTEVLAPDQPGHYCLRATLVQEQVTWFDAPVCNHFLETEMVVE